MCRRVKATPATRPRLDVSMNELSNVSHRRHVPVLLCTYVPSAFTGSRVMGEPGSPCGKSYLALSLSPLKTNRCGTIFFVCQNNTRARIFSDAFASQELFSRVTKETSLVLRSVSSRLQSRNLVAKNTHGKYIVFMKVLLNTGVVSKCKSTLVEDIKKSYTT